jgi:hypothetical protein
MGAIGVATGTAILFGISTVKLQQGLAALGVSLSAAEQVTISGAAAGTAAARSVLDRFGTQIAGEITTTLREAFVAGLHGAYWFALALTVVGVVVGLTLDDSKLKNVDR